MPSNERQARHVPGIVGWVDLNWLIRTSIREEGWKIVNRNQLKGYD